MTRHGKTLEPLLVPLGTPSRPIRRSNVAVLYQRGVEQAPTSAFPAQGIRRGSEILAQARVFQAAAHMGMDQATEASGPVELHACPLKFGEAGQFQDLCGSVCGPGHGG